MFLQIFSVYDKVARQSVFVNMHHTIDEAIREFKSFIDNPQLSNKKDDLILVHIGHFCPSDPSITIADSVVVYPEVIE